MREGLVDVRSDGARRPAGGAGAAATAGTRARHRPAVRRSATCSCGRSVALMACAGLRCVEASTARLARRRHRRGDGDRQRQRPAGAADRPVADVVRAVAALRLARRAGRSAPCSSARPGRACRRHGVSQRVNRAFRAVGSTTRAHQLRHRCATQALQQPGVDLLAVRDLLGHASVSTTQIYTAVMPGRTAAASRALRMPAA